MILTCPKCNARFLVNAAALRPDGRDVRCGRCKHEWFAKPPEEVRAAAFATAPDPEPVRFVEPRPIPPGSNLPVLARRKRRPIGAIVGWVLLGIVVLALALTAIEREQIMALYPETRDVYAALGFEVPVPGAGLQITDVVSSRTVQEGVSVLVSEGRVSNVSDIERHVPPLRGVLRDSAGRELQGWTFRATEDRLGPRESVPFRTEVRQPAATAAELSITFIAGD